MFKYLSFTGQSGCYAELPLSVLPAATTFTIEVKFSTTSTNNTSYNWTWGTIAGRELPNHWQDDFGFCVNNGKLCFWAEPKVKNSLTKGTGGVFSNAVVNDGEVHEVAVVSSNSAIYLYCDGELVASQSNVKAKTPTSQTILLAYDSDPNSYLQMDLYEARFWNVARTQEQIFADIDGTETGLQAWYLPSAGGLLDYSGNVPEAILFGNPIFTPLGEINFKPEVFMSWLPHGEINFKPEVFASWIPTGEINFKPEIFATLIGEDIICEFNADLRRKLVNSVEFNADLKRTLIKRVDFNADLRRSLANTVDLSVDLRRKLVNRVEFNADLKRTLIAPVDFTVDLRRSLVNVADFTFDLHRKLINRVEFSVDLKRTIIAPVDFTVDLRRSLVNTVDFTFDLHAHIYWQWLTRILPESSFLDSKMYASAEALDVQITKLYQSIREVLHLPRLDELSGTILDLLAEQFHVDYYDAINFSDAEKRNLIRQSIAWHRLKGTPAAVEMVLQDAFKDLRIDEWFTYGGEPYFFRLWTKGYISTPERFKSFWLMFMDAKNVRSQLEMVTIDHSHDEPIQLYTGVAKVTSGLKIIDLPKHDDAKINLHTGVAIVNVGQKIIGLPKHNDIHTKIYSGVYQIHTGTIFIGMKRNPF